MRLAGRRATRGAPRGSRARVARGAARAREARRAPRSRAVERAGLLRRHPPRFRRPRSRRAEKKAGPTARPRLAMHAAQARRVCRRRRLPAGARCLRRRGAAEARVRESTRAIGATPAAAAGSKPDDDELVAAADAERHQRHGAARDWRLRPRARISSRTATSWRSARDQRRRPRVDAVRVFDHHALADDGARRRLARPRSGRPRSPRARTSRSPAAPGVHARVDDRKRSPLVTITGVMRLGARRATASRSKLSSRSPARTGRPCARAAEALAAERRRYRCRRA